MHFTFATKISEILYVLDFFGHMYETQNINVGFHSHN